MLGFKCVPSVQPAGAGTQSRPGYDKPSASEARHFSEIRGTQKNRLVSRHLIFPSKEICRFTLRDHLT